MLWSCWEIPFTNPTVVKFFWDGTKHWKVFVLEFIFPDKNPSCSHSFPVIVFLTFSCFIVTPEYLCKVYSEGIQISCSAVKDGCVAVTLPSQQSFRGAFIRWRCHLQCQMQRVRKGSGIECNVTQITHPKYINWRSRRTSRCEQITHPKHTNSRSRWTWTVRRKLRSLNRNTKYLPLLKLLRRLVNCIRTSPI